MSSPTPCPAGVTFDSATPTQGSLLGGGRHRHLRARHDRRRGKRERRDRGAAPQPPGSITNQASVTSSLADPDSTDNSAGAETTVDPAIGYPRPKGASPLRVSLVPAFTACANPNVVHGPALEHPACNPPAPASTYLTVGTPDANGAAANSIGFLKLGVQFNQSPTPNDVLVDASITDVRCGAGVSACGAANSADGPDYTGELQATYQLRITDKFNGTGGGTPATVTDTSFAVTIACAQTTSASIGGSCELSTSANAVVPGSVQSANRAIWELGQVQVLDGGPDGIAATTGNTLFVRQGIFIP